MYKCIDFLLMSILRQMKIRYRLIGAFIFLSMSPLLISGFIAYGESSKAINIKTRVFFTEMVKQVSKNIQLQMAQIETDSESLVLSDRVQSELTNYASADPEKNGLARTAMTKILLDAYGSVDLVNQKYFLDKDDHLVDLQVFLRLGRGVEQLASQAGHGKNHPYWSSVAGTSGSRAIVMLREIYFKDNNRLAGSLFLGIRPRYFSDMLSDVDLGIGSELCIIDLAEGKYIVNPQDKLSQSGASLVSGGLLQSIRDHLKQGQQTGFVSYLAMRQSGSPDEKTMEFLAAFAPIPHTSWFVVSSIPSSNLLVEAESARNKIVLVGFVCFLVAIILAFIISSSISTPLGKLVADMRNAKSGHFSRYSEQEGNDELTELGQKFNEMSMELAWDREQLEQRVAQRTRELEEANRQLEQLSMTDSLTGIANRRCFDTALGVELRRAARIKKPLALIMLDIDFFKNYNDYYGHQDGDICLCEVAHLLQLHAGRAGDMAARYGGGRIRHSGCRN